MKKYRTVAVETCIIKCKKEWQSAVRVYKNEVEINFDE
jgi:hypothetical protein